MDIRIPKAIYQAHAAAFKKKPFNWDGHALAWRDHFNINLQEYEAGTLKKLAQIVMDDLTIKGARSIVRDVNAWIIATTGEGAADGKAYTVKEMSIRLIETLRKTKRKHLYKRVQNNQDGYLLCYYVEAIHYYPPEKQRDWFREEHINIHLAYEEMGIRNSETFTLYRPHCLGKSPAEAIAILDYMFETPALRIDYETYMENYAELKDDIGCQCLAVGVADDRGIDGNDESDEDRRWWRSSKLSNLILDREGDPARVVIDIRRELPKDDDDDDRKESRAAQGFWSDRKPKKVAKGKEAVWDEEEDEVVIAEIPIHPYLPIFDLRRHVRLRCHVGNLTPYIYNEGLSDSLILPEVNRKLIDTLLAGKHHEFRDLVSGKGGGTVILCQGKPGTGKTLTAEVYAEASQRPLYTVQCSQLGTDADSLEDNLLKILARGARWNAIMLLDEADVYVHARGNDLQQNAIVGVFLRVLEYQKGVLFLTTNRGDLVDDAILSRCTARIPFQIPSRDEQQAIWEVLAKANQIALSKKTIKQIVDAHPKLSGRDIKNLLKLAAVVATDRGQQITPDLITEVKVFKPTYDADTDEMTGKDE